MANVKREILSQGQFDGACLLYAIMNAYKTLTKGKTKTCEKKWYKLIENLPSVNSYLNGVGSGGIDLDLEQEIVVTKSIINNAFLLLGGKKHRLVVKQLKKITDLKKTKLKESVLIFCIINKGLKSTFHKRTIKDHWITVVSKDKESCFIQCSYAIHDVNDYREINIDKSDRYYNDSFKVDNINGKNVHPDFIYSVSLR